MLTTVSLGVIAALAITAPAAEAFMLPAHDGGATAPAIERPAAPPVATPAITAPDEATFTIDTAAVIVTADPIPRPAAPKVHPKVKRAAPANERSSGHTFNVRITGHQEALDRCKGFVWEDFGANGNVVSAHRGCGGAVILTLRMGDTVKLRGYGEGTYKVVQIKNVKDGTSSRTLNGHLWMQTCTYGSNKLHLVRLAPID